jgi:hypothetical protein
MAKRKGFLQKPSQLGARNRRIGESQRGAGPHDEIQTAKVFPRMAKNIARNPLVEIAGNRCFHEAFADDDPEAGRSPPAGANINLKPAAACAALIGKNGRIRVRSIQALRARKRKYRAAAQALLDGQACAPLGAARTDYCTTGPRFHAHAESVRFLASCGRRLIGPFHGRGPVNVKSPLLQPVTPFSVNVHGNIEISCRRPRALVDNSIRKR